jgi:hypothetical protein
MERYDYEESVRKDIEDYIKDNYETEELKEKLDDSDFEDELYDDMFVSDSVTGKGSGSYFFNRWKAEEALCHNMDLLEEALKEFGCGIDYLEKGPEACDVMIRCYILGQEFWSVFEDMKETLLENQ